MFQQQQRAHLQHLSLPLNRVENTAKYRERNNIHNRRNADKRLSETVQPNANGHMDIIANPLDSICNIRHAHSTP